MSRSRDQCIISFWNIFAIWLEARISSSSVGRNENLNFFTPGSLSRHLGSLGGRFLSVGPGCSVTKPWLLPRGRCRRQKRVLTRTLRFGVLCGSPRTTGCQQQRQPRGPAKVPSRGTARPAGRPGQQDAEFPANALVCEPTPQPPTATSHARPFPTPWTPASLSAFGFSRAGLSLSSVPE